jgi:predicted RNA binding protein YcfA (HicA-like mRNA interferase family)
MPPFGPVSRRDLIRALRQAGFDGPYSGGKHQYMTNGGMSLTIPSPHQGDIGRELLARMLRQADISREEWERLG